MATNLIDVELQSPFQNQPIGETGLDLGETSIAQDPFGFGEKVAQIDVGRQFGQLLDKGQEGMIATANALISEGTFTPEELQGLDPNLPAFQSQEGQVAWYSGIKAKIDAKAKAKTTKNIAEAATLEEAQNIASGAGRLTTKEQLDIVGSKEEEERKLGRSQTAQKIISGLEFSELKDGEVSSKSISDILQGLTVQERDALFDSKNQEFDPVFEKIIESIQSDARSTLAHERFGLSLQRLKVSEDRGQTQRLKSYNALVKDSPFIADLVNGFVDKMKESGYEGDIFDITKEGDIPSFGFGKKRLKRFFLDKDSQEVKSLVNWMSIAVRHDFFGATLTGNELKSFNEAMGNQSITSEFALIVGIQKIAKRAKSNMEQAQTLLRPEDFEILKREGLMTADQVGMGSEGKPKSDSKKGGSVIKLNKEATDEELIKAFKKKFDEDPTIGQIKIMRSNLKRRGR